MKIIKAIKKIKKFLKIKSKRVKTFEKNIDNLTDYDFIKFKKTNLYKNIRKEILKEDKQ